MSNVSHYMFGKVLFAHKEHTTATSVGSTVADATISKLQSIYKYDVGYVPAGYEHRPDLISDIFYETPEYWWLLLLFNNITDPFEEFNVGDRILIPRL